MPPFITQVSRTQIDIVKHWIISLPSEYRENSYCVHIGGTMKIAISSVVVVATCAFVSNAWAGDCVLHVKRDACEGKNAESFAKCGGKAECDETKKTGSADACAKQALKACENVGDRQQVTKSKVITAKFDGKDVENGKNFCEANRPDFNKCK